MLGKPKFGKVFVLYPRGVRTGGPLCLHQLVHGIRELGGEAFLTPWSGTEGQKRVLEYEKYDAPEAPIDDEEDNLVISAEFTFRDIASVKSAQRSVWWLSFDNSVPARYALHSRGARRLLRNTLSNSKREELMAFTRTIFSRRPAKHFHQSEYARQEISRFFRLKSEPLLDYTVAAPDSKGTRNSDSFGSKRPTVCFNPAKGSEARIARVMNRLPDLNWVPLRNMSHEALLDVVAKSDLYLDLGKFPGRDRIPREAVLAGTPVILGARGSARNPIDFGIPEDYKLAFDSGWEGQLVEKIGLTLKNKEKAKSDQSSFRTLVSSEAEVFRQQLKRYFFER